MTCSYLKSFLIDFTIDQCFKVGIPVAKTRIATLYNYKDQRFDRDVELRIAGPSVNGTPLLLVPKRWLRFVPWINFDDYFATACPKDDVVNRVS